jgi:hypothetical protein
MDIVADLERIAAAAPVYGDGRELSGVLATEALPGARVYVCAFGADDAERAWIALDDAGEPIGERRGVRDAVSIAALCEVAEEAAGIEPEGPRLASPALLDELGASAGPELAAAIGAATGTIEELVRDVERGYKRPLS